MSLLNYFPVKSRTDIRFEVIQVCSSPPHYPSSPPVALQEEVGSACLHLATVRQAEKRKRGRNAGAWS